IRVPADAPAAGESATRRMSPGPAAEDDFPEGWLTGDDGSSTADHVAPEADDYEVPSPSAALPPPVGKSRKSGNSEGAFVPVQGVSQPPKTSRQRSDQTASSSSKTSMRQASGWRQHLIWVLLMALVPLGISTVAESDSFESRLQETLRQHPEAAQRLEQAQSKDEFFAS